MKNEGLGFWKSKNLIINLVFVKIKNMKRSKSEEFKLGWEFAYSLPEGYKEYCKKFGKAVGQSRGWLDYIAGNEAREKHDKKNSRNYKILEKREFKQSLEDSLFDLKNVFRHGLNYLFN